MARGLGSSCAAIVAGILAGTALAPFLQRKCAAYDARVSEGRKVDGGERDATLFAMEGEWLHQAGLAVEVCDENFLLKLACDLEVSKACRLFLVGAAYVLCCSAFVPGVGVYVSRVANFPPVVFEQSSCVWMERPVVRRRTLAVSGSCERVGCSQAMFPNTSQ